MKWMTAILLVSGLNAYGQNSHLPVPYSPDKNYQLFITTEDLGEQSIGWKYWLISSDKDTTLLTSTRTRDELPPAAFWTKSLSEIIFEAQTAENDENKIKIYNLKTKKVEFETFGFIWGPGRSNFDEDQGYLFYFKRKDNINAKFDLLELNIVTKEIRILTSVVTDGDPMGAPEIESIDKVKKQLTVMYQSPDWKQVTTKVEY